MRYAQYFGSYGGRRYFRGAGRRQRRHRRREYLRPAADGLSGNGPHDRYRLLGGGFDPLVAVEDPGGPPERHAGDGVRDGGDLAAVFGDSAFPRPDGCVAGGLFSQVGLATQAMLYHTGVQTVLPPGYLCCGYPQAATGNNDKADQITTDNRVLFHRVANTLN